MPALAKPISLAAFTALLMTGSAFAEAVTLSGDIAYRERIALPETAVAQVQLIDVSLADAPAITIAEEIIDPAGQVPIGFVLDFESSAITEGHSYAISARIEVDGELWFINDARILVDPLTQNEPIAVDLVSARDGEASEGEEADASAIPADLAGTSWFLTELNAAPAAEGVESTLIFGDDGGLGGNGGCNSYGGSIAVDADGGIDISEVFSTMMACEEPKMGQERDFFAALNAATAYAIEAGTLSLYDDGGEIVARLRAGEAQEQAQIDGQLTGTTWHAAILLGEPAAAGVETTLAFREDGLAAGHSGCNSFSGPVTAGPDGAFDMSDFVTTQIGCFDPVGTQERALYDAFSAAAAYEIVDDRLILRDAEGTVVAEFSRGQ